MKKKIYPKDHEKALYELAERQSGLFTAQQARELGFDDRHHPYHAQAGNWVRLERGIYRLSKFPYSDSEQYVLWTLWSRNRKGMPQGVISHATALELYSLSDYTSRKIHLTVPKSFRRSAQHPKEIVLHYANLQKEDIQERAGFRITTPLKTIIDLIEENKASPEFIQQAMAEASKKGFITSSNLKELRKQMSRKGNKQDETIP